MLFLKDDQMFELFRQTDRESLVRERLLGCWDIFSGEKWWVVFFFFYPSVYNTSFVRSVAAVSKTVSHFHKSGMFSGMIWAALYFPSVHSHNFTLPEQFFTLRYGCIAEISSLKFCRSIWKTFDQKHFQSALVVRNHSASFWLLQKPETTAASCH